MPLRMTGVAKWPFIGNFKFEHARDLTLVSIPMVLGLRNSFGLEWPFMAILARKMAILVTFVFNILETDFGVYSQLFGHEKFIGPIFRCLRLTWMAKLSICPSVEGGDDPKKQSALARHAAINHSALMYLAIVNGSVLTYQATMNHSGMMH